MQVPGSNFLGIAYGYIKESDVGYTKRPRGFQEYTILMIYIMEKHAK